MSTRHRRRPASGASRSDFGDGAARAVVERPFARAGAGCNTTRMAGPTQWIRAVVRAVPPYRPASGRRWPPGRQVNANENPYRRRRSLRALHDAVDERAAVPRSEAVALRWGRGTLYGVSRRHPRGQRLDEPWRSATRPDRSRRRRGLPVPTYSLTPRWWRCRAEANRGPLAGRLESAPALERRAPS